MASESESSSHLETRHGARSPERSDETSDRGRHGEIYLIERQAIDLRRRRWAQATTEGERSHDTSARNEQWSRSARDTQGSELPPRDPSLAPYERPRPDPAEARSDKGAIARTVAWLRQTLLLGD